MGMGKTLTFFFFFFFAPSPPRTSPALFPFPFPFFLPVNIIAGAFANGFPSGPNATSSSNGKECITGSAERTMSGWAVMTGAAEYEVTEPTGPGGLEKPDGRGGAAAGLTLGILGANLRAADHSPVAALFAFSEDVAVVVDVSVQR